MERNKQAVINCFLDFVSEYVPLHRARIATLGGHGIEAKVWTARGIPPNNGWLIERSLKLNRGLIKNYRYHVLNQMSAFRKILFGHGENLAFVDAFHLDLSGTLKSGVISKFKSALDLILRSPTRVLAITVADQRNNLATQNWPACWTRAKDVFGSSADSIYDQICREQKALPATKLKGMPDYFKPFNPENGARREIGFMLEFLEMISSLGYLPDKVKRFIYISKYSGRSFRMRTYLFHFVPHKSKHLPQITAGKWIESRPRFFSHEEGQLEPTVETTGAIHKQTKGEKVQSIQEKIAAASPIHKLLQIAAVVGEDCKKELIELISNSKRYEEMRAQFLAGTNGVHIEHVEAPSSTRTSSRRVNTEISSTRPVFKKYEDMSDVEQIEWLVSYGETRAKLEAQGKWSNAEYKRIISQTFGPYTKPLGKKMRAVTSRLCGAFRPELVSRIRRQCAPGVSDRFIARLQEVPTKFKRAS